MPVPPHGVALQDVLKEKLYELEKEIGHYRKENSAIEQLRKERESVRVTTIVTVQVQMCIPYMHATCVLYTYIRTCFRKQHGSHLSMYVRMYIGTYMCEYMYQMCSIRTYIAHG